jgi:hypothetical protein
MIVLMLTSSFYKLELNFFLCEPEPALSTYITFDCIGDGMAMFVLISFFDHPHNEVTLVCEPYREILTHLLYDCVYKFIQVQK